MLGEMFFYLVGVVVYEDIGFYWIGRWRSVGELCKPRLGGDMVGGNQLLREASGKSSTTKVLHAWV